MNRRIKIVAHGWGWLFAFGAVLVSPVILIFGPPLFIGVAADLVEVGGQPLGVILFGAACLLGWRPLRALIKALIHTVALSALLRTPPPGYRPSKSIGWPDRDQWP